MTVPVDNCTAQTVSPRQCFLRRQYLSQDCHDRQKRLVTASLRYAGKIVNLVCGFSNEHLSWQTNPSPKSRTAQTCGTLGAITKDKMRHFRVCFFGLLLFTISCAQTDKNEHSYSLSIDGSVKGEVEKNLTTYDKVIMGGMKCKMFENDSLIADTYKRDKSSECILFASIDNDTINIRGQIGMFDGFGYSITLVKDTCFVLYYIKSDTPTYKVNKSDSLTFGVSVPCESYKLVLTNTPTFKKGDVIEGIIELTSEDYYETSNEQERKYKIHLTGYFKTEPLQSTEDKLNALQTDTLADDVKIIFETTFEKDTVSILLDSSKTYTEVISTDDRLGVASTTTINRKKAITNLVSIQVNNNRPTDVKEIEKYNYALVNFSDNKVAVHLTNKRPYYK